MVSVSQEIGARILESRRVVLWRAEIPGEWTRAAMDRIGLIGHMGLIGVAHWCHSSPEL